MLNGGTDLPGWNIPLAAIGAGDWPVLWTVIGLYLATLVGVGLVFRRFSRDTSDYFRAGGKAKWWLVGGSVFMGNFSAWTFTGAAGAAYEAGWSLVWLYGAGTLAYLLVAWLSAARFRQTRMVTTADVIRLRFGPGMEQFYAYMQSVAAPLYGGVQLYALAIFTTSLLGLDVRLAILTLGVVVLCYTALGGAWAAMAADFIKGLILLPVCVLVAVVCLRHFGGLRGFLEAIETAGLTRAFTPLKTAEASRSLPGLPAGYFTWGFFAAYYCTQLIPALGLGNAGKFLAVKTGREARGAALLAAGVLLVGMFIFFLPPMTARILLPGEVAALPLRFPHEGAYAAAAMHFLPIGVVSLVFVAMCASTMSTLDVTLTSLAGLITQNLYPSWCVWAGRTPATGGPLLRLGRMINAACALTVILCALVMVEVGSGGVFKLFIDIMALVGFPLGIPLLLGLFVRGVAARAAPCAVAAGVLVSAAFAYGPRLMGAAAGRPYHEQVFGTLVAGTLSFFVAGRRGRRGGVAEDEREREFFARRDVVVNFDREIGDGSDGRQLRIIGVFGLSMGLGVLLLAWLPSSAGFRGEIAAVAATIGIIGGLLVSSSRWSR